MSKRRTESGDWSSRAEALLHSTRADHAPSAADRARVRSALSRRLADASPDALANKTASRVGLGKLAIVGLGVVCGVAAMFAIMHPGESAKRADPKPPTNQLSPPAADASQRATDPARASEDTAAVSSRVNSAPPARLAPKRPRLRPEPAPAPARSEPELAAVEPAVDPQPTVAASTGAVARDSRPGFASRTDTQPSAATTRPSPVAQPARVAAEAEAEADARAELAFVARIQAAMLAAKPRTVLGLCAEHQRRWPHGTFVEEREGLRAIASCSGATSDAATRARTFLAHYPHAAIAPRVRDACTARLTAAIERAAPPKP